MYVVRWAYEATNNSEITVSRGDEVEFVRQESGMFKVREYK